VRRALLLSTVAAALLSVAAAGLTPSAADANAKVKSLWLSVPLPAAGEQRFVDLQVRLRAHGRDVQWLSVAATNSVRIPADIRAGAAVTRPVIRDGVATMHVLVAINNLADDVAAPEAASKQPDSLDVIVGGLGAELTGTTAALGSCAPWEERKSTYRIWYYVRFEHRPASPREIFANSTKQASASGRC
jgi:hypothetical protein